MKFCFRVSKLALRFQVIKLPLTPIQPTNYQLFFGGEVSKFLLKHWFRHLIIIAGVIFLAYLGFWQLRRLDERRALNEEILAGLNRPPVILVGQSVDPDEMHRQRVTVTGTFANDENIIIKTQSYQGRAGIDLVVPLQIKDSEQVVLVNRGWLPFENFEPEARRAFDLEGEITIDGVAYRSQQPPHSLAPTDPEPQLGKPVDSWFRLELDKIQKQIEAPLLPIYVQALPDEELDVTPPIREPITDLGEGSHLNYALQWFSFSLILAITYAGFMRQEYTQLQKKKVTDQSTEVLNQ